MHILPLYDLLMVGTTKVPWDVAKVVSWNLGYFSWTLPYATWALSAPRSSRVSSSAQLPHIFCCSGRTIGVMFRLDVSIDDDSAILSNGLWCVCIGGCCRKDSSLQMFNCRVFKDMDLRNDPRKLEHPPRIELIELLVKRHVAQAASNMRTLGSSQVALVR